MYVHRQISRHFLPPLSKHRHKYIIVIYICVIFLLFTAVRKDKLRSIDTKKDILEDKNEKVISESSPDYVTDEERDILTKSFRTADFDGDKQLSQSEISMAISRETKQHILVSYIWFSYCFDLVWNFSLESNEEQFSGVFLPG